MALKERRTTKGQRDNERLAGLLNRLSGDRLAISFQPGMFYQGDNHARGHLFSLTFNDVTGEMHDLHFSTADERRTDASVPQQVIEWLDANIAKLHEIKGDLVLSMAAGELG